LTTNADIDCEPHSLERHLTSVFRDTVSVDQRSSTTAHSVLSSVPGDKQLRPETFHKDTAITTCQSKRSHAHLYRLSSKHVVDTIMQTTDTEDDDKLRTPKKREKSRKWSSSDDSTAGGHAPSAWTYQKVSHSSSKSSIQKLSKSSFVACPPQIFDSTCKGKNNMDFQYHSSEKPSQRKNYPVVLTTCSSSSRIISSTPNTAQATDAFTFLDDRVFSIPADLGGQAKTQPVSPRRDDKVSQNILSAFALDPTKYQLNASRELRVNSAEKVQCTTPATSTNSDAYTFKCDNPSRTPVGSSLLAKSLTTPVDDVFIAVSNYRTTSVTNTPCFVVSERTSSGGRPSEIKQPFVSKVAGNVPLSNRIVEQKITLGTNVKNNKDVSELYIFNVKSVTNPPKSPVHSIGISSFLQLSNFQESTNHTKPYDALIAAVDSVKKSIGSFPLSTIPTTCDAEPNDGKTPRRATPSGESDRAKKLGAAFVPVTSNTVSKQTGSFFTADKRQLSTVTTRSSDGTVPKNGTSSLKLRTDDRSLSQWTFTVDTPAGGTGTAPRSSGLFVNTQQQRPINNVPQLRTRTDVAGYSALPNRPTLSTVRDLPKQNSTRQKSDQNLQARNDSRKPNTLSRHSFQLQFITPLVTNQVPLLSSPSTFSASQQFPLRDVTLSRNTNQNAVSAKPVENIIKNIPTEPVLRSVRNSLGVDKGVNRISSYDNVSSCASSSLRLVTGSRATVISSETRYSQPWDEKDVTDYVQPPMSTYTTGGHKQEAANMSRVPLISCPALSSTTERAQSASRCGVNRSSGLILNEVDITNLHRSCFEIKSAQRTGAVPSAAASQTKNLTTRRRGVSQIRIDTQLFPQTLVQREKTACSIPNPNHLFVKENDNFRYSCAGSDWPDSEYFGTNDCLQYEDVDRMNPVVKLFNFMRDDNSVFGFGSELSHSEQKSPDVIPQISKLQNIMYCGFVVFKTVA